MPFDFSIRAFLWLSFSNSINDHFIIFVLDMTFDDDTKLFGLMRRYSEPEEQEELQRQVIQYVRT